MYVLRPVVLLFLFLTSLSAFATSLSEAEAWNNALQFQLKRSASKLKSTPLLRLVNIESSVNRLRASKNPAYYVFNIGDNQGFVIVSGETGTKTILGYSDEGQIQTTLIPDNLKALLANYELEIDSVRSGTYQILDSNFKNTTGVNPSTPVVPPLLSMNRWAQLEPYNLFCPWDFSSKSRSAVGCVALAMGQIMHYHQWPLHPKGTINYYADNIGLLSVNLDSTTYDWSAMSYTSNPVSTSTQDTLIAKLLHHCGVSVKMQYSSIGSAAEVIDVGPAMVNNFGYDSDIQHYKREFFTNESWESMLRKELDEARPVLYAAFSKEAGHVFVCDGYDSNNLYHINWGWGGNGNGYFELSSLNYDYPGTTGVTNKFSKDQSMLIRIQRPDQTKQTTYSLGMMGGNLQAPTYTFNRKSTFSVQFNCRNFGTNSFEAYLGLGYYDSNNQLKLLEKTATRLESMQAGRAKAYAQSGLILPSDMKEGLYRIFALYRIGDSMKWNILPGTNGIYLQIGGETAKFLAGNTSAILELKTPINILHQVYQNQIAEVYVTFMNYDIAYSATLVLDLYSEPDAKFVKTIYQASHQLQASSIQTLQLKIVMNCPPGNYSLVARSNSRNEKYLLARMEPSVCNNLKFSVKPAPGPSNLQLVDSMSLQLGLSMLRQDSLKLKATVANYGGFTNKTMVGLIFKKDVEACLDTLLPTEIYIDSLETRTLYLKGNLSLRDGEYHLTLCQLTDNLIVPLGPSRLSSIPFTIGNPLAGKDSLHLYWHLNDDRLIVDGDHKIECINLYNLSGILLKKVEHQDFIQVGSLAKGLYIVKVKMNGNLLVDKYFRK